ncbi:MAG: TolC family protein [Bacteroidia bacterium]
MNKIALCFILLFLTSWLHAQKYWTLEECVNTGLKNNITLKQQELNKESAKADMFQSRMNMLPSVNASATNNWNIGFAIDPVTNASTRDATFRSNSVGLSASWTLFNGFQNMNNYRLQRTNTQAIDQDVLNTKNNMALQICNAYLQVLLSMELAESRRLQTQATQLQVNKQEKMYELGGSSRTKLLQLRAQLSNEELQAVLAENQLDQAYLTLWQSMNILPDTVNKVKKPEVDMTKMQDEARTADQVFEAYAQNSPELKAAELRTRSAEIGTSIAVGGRSPRLSLGAGLNSFYTTQNITPTSFETNWVPFGYDANRNPSGLFTPVSYITGTKTVPFSEQFDKNLGKNIGLQLSIPIFNGWQVNNNIQKQRINQMNAGLNEQQVRNTTYKNINQAYLDFKSALKKYEFNVQNLDANKESAALADAQFSLGAIGMNDYLQTRNAYLQAETNFLQAKYELQFRRKVLDFYLGKPLY